MIAARRKRRRTLSITSLIDVIFLLLLFFMLASTFQQFSELEVGGVSASGGSAEASKAESFSLIVGPSQLTLDGAAMADAQLVRRLSVASDKPKKLNLQVASGVSSQRLIDIMVLLEPISDLNVNLVAQP
ncbi:MAG: biopolymer transporter ExbD [Pseudomonadota bacterium]